MFNFSKIAQMFNFSKDEWIDDENLWNVGSPIVLAIRIQMEIIE